MKRKKEEKNDNLLERREYDTLSAMTQKVMGHASPFSSTRIYFNSSSEIIRKISKKQNS